MRRRHPSPLCKPPSWLPTIAGHAATEHSDIMCATYAASATCAQRSIFRRVSVITLGVDLRGESTLEEVPVDQFVPLPPRLSGIFLCHCCCSLSVLWINRLRRYSMAYPTW